MTQQRRQAMKDRYMGYSQDQLAEMIVQLRIELHEARNQLHGKQLRMSAMTKQLAALTDVPLVEVEIVDSESQDTNFDLAVTSSQPAQCCA